MCCLISLGPDFKVLCTDFYTLTITHDQGNLYKFRYVYYITSNAFSYVYLRKMHKT